MIVSKYDYHSDVLYLAIEKPSRAFSDEQPDGLLFRFSYETGKPCGVTVFDYRLRWSENRNLLADKVASFLSIGPAEIMSALKPPENL